MSPLAMLNDWAEIYSTTVLVAIEDMMEQLVPHQQQVGFHEATARDEPRRKVAAANGNHTMGAERWFFGADLEKAYDETAHEFGLTGLSEMRVLLDLVRWIA